jgi:hypothetical protein
MQTWADDVRKLVEAVRRVKKPRTGFILGFSLALFFAAIAISNRGLHSPKDASTQSLERVQFQPQVDLVNAKAYSAAPIAFRPAAYSQGGELLGQPVFAGKGVGDAANSRSIVRTASIDMLVQHPAEIAQQITELTEKLGGYLVNENGGGQNATTGTLTVRIPVAQFEQARAEIRKLGLRVESEKFDATDVTQESVDQEATLRNLRAEEAQYLAILQQAHNVNDMLYVSQKLTEVRGKIEKQEAEFDSMMHQTETVVIAISLRTESEERTFSVNWRPLTELKRAAADGLQEIVNYGMVMAAILFNLPALLLWAGTIFVSVVFGWRTVQWLRRRWSHWTAVQDSIQ